MLLRRLAPLLLHQRAQPVLEGHLDQDAGGGGGGGGEVLGGHRAEPTLRMPTCDFPPPRRSR